MLAFDFLDACLSVRADDPLALLTAACRADMGTLARIEGFSDPWEKPLRFVHPDKLKKLSKEEKEARLLVAAWQGRQDEVGRVMNSGKPAPRTDTVGMSRNEEKVRIIGGGSKNPFGNSKAGRGKTVINAASFPKDLSSDTEHRCTRRRTEANWTFARSSWRKYPAQGRHAVGRVFRGW